MVAVTNAQIATPDGHEWLGELYATVVERISNDGFVQYLMATSQGLNGEIVGKNEETSSYRKGC
ncbi:MAG: hypothetical protein R2911_21635 [Caldilineaceae bacterium]